MKIEATTQRSQFRSLATGLAVLGLIALLSFGATCVQPGADAAPQSSTQKSVASQPVILLTGFEPFGEGRPPNPSWESIKDLDGKTWKGYTLKCRQLSVVWGATLEQLQDWIAQYRPVAIFSFGQGAPKAFAFESVASNSRGRHADNRGELPGRPNIADDGPAEVKTSIDCAKFARALADKGHPTRVSTAAGRYLCEEALYTLEYLKAAKKVSGTVMFCHVPPVGSPLGKKKVTVENIQEFVKDTLETWHTLHHNDVVPVVAEQGDKETHIKDIKEFVGRYFRTWSEQDMKGYDGCFLPDASIQFISPSGKVSTYTRKKFIADQTEYHKTATVRATEVAESVDIKFEAKLARVVVFWKLTAGARTETGYDHFTLLRHEGSWRIVHLVFYASARKD